MPVTINQTSSFQLTDKLSNHRLINSCQRQVGKMLGKANGHSAGNTVQCQFYLPFQRKLAPKTSAPLVSVHQRWQCSRFSPMLLQEVRRHPKGFKGMIHRWMIRRWLSRHPVHMAGVGTTTGM